MGRRLAGGVAIWRAVLPRYPTRDLPRGERGHLRCPLVVVGHFSPNRRRVPVHVAVAAVAFGRCPAPSHRHRLVDCWICPCRRYRPPILMRASRSGSRLVFRPGVRSLSRCRQPASLFHCLDGRAPSLSGHEPLSSSSLPPREVPLVAPVARCLQRAPTSAFAHAVVVIVVAPLPPGMRTGRTVATGTGVQTATAAIEAVN
jgi:hypothetical protein